VKAALFTELDCAARQIRDPCKVAAQTHGIYDPDGCFNTLGKIKRLVCSDAQKLTEDNARFRKNVGPVSVPTLS